MTDIDNASRRDDTQACLVGRYVSLDKSFRSTFCAKMCRDFDCLWPKQASSAIGRRGGLEKIQLRNLPKRSIGINYQECGILLGRRIADAGSSSGR